MLRDNGAPSGVAKDRYGKWVIVYQNGALDGERYDSRKEALEAMDAIERERQGGEHSRKLDRQAG